MTIRTRSYTSPSSSRKHATMSNAPGAYSRISKWFTTASPSVRDSIGRSPMKKPLPAHPKYFGYVQLFEMMQADSSHNARSAAVTTRTDLLTSVSPTNDLSTIRHKKHVAGKHYNRNATESVNLPLQKQDALSRVPTHTFDFKKSNGQREREMNARAATYRGGFCRRLEALLGRFLPELAGALMGAGTFRGVGA